MNDATCFLDLAAEVQPPADGILSRTLHEDEKVRAIVFGFGPGQELSEHTASKPALLWFVRGEARVGLGERNEQARPGTFIHMPAGLKHSIAAKTPVVMLLLLLK